MVVNFVCLLLEGLKFKLIHVLRELNQSIDLTLCGNSSHFNLFEITVQKVSDVKVLRIKVKIMSNVYNYNKLFNFNNTKHNR